MAKQDIMLFSNEGKAIRFNESKIRAMGRTAKGYAVCRWRYWPIKAWKTMTTIELEDDSQDDQDNDSNRCG